MYDYSKLRGRIREVYGTEGAFAKAIGKSGPTLSQIFSGKAEFWQSDIKTACTLLKIPPTKISDYFFSVKS
jgi:hypothetical protein